MDQQCCHPPPGREHGQAFSQAAVPSHPHGPTGGGWKLGATEGKNREGDKPFACSTPGLDALQDWQILRGDLVITRTTGRDYFGSSWQGKWKDIEVEITEITISKKGAEKCLQEVGLLKGLRHPNLLSLLGVCAEEGRVLIVSERPLNASPLLPGFGGRGQVGLPLHLHVLAQTASALAYLEEHDLVHLEVAARNTLLTSDLVCKLMVRGMIVREGNNISDGCIAAVSMAPEVVAGGSVTSKSGVWAFASFMLEILQGGGGGGGILNFQGLIQDHKMSQDTREGQHTLASPPIPDTCPPALRQLLKTCLSAVPESRPTFASLRDALQEQADGLREELLVCLEASKEF